MRTSNGTALYGVYFRHTVKCATKCVSKITFFVSCFHIWAKFLTFCDNSYVASSKVAIESVKHFVADQATFFPRTPSTWKMRVAKLLCYTLCSAVQYGAVWFVATWAFIKLTCALYLGLHTRSVRNLLYHSQMTLCTSWANRSVELPIQKCSNTQTFITKLGTKHGSNFITCE